MHVRMQTMRATMHAYACIHYHVYDPPEAHPKPKTDSLMTQRL